MTQRTAGTPKSGTGMVKKAAGDDESAGLIEQVCSPEQACPLTCAWTSVCRFYFVNNGIN